MRFNRRVERVSTSPQPLYQLEINRSEYALQKPKRQKMRNICSNMTVRDAKKITGRPQGTCWGDGGSARHSFDVPRVTKVLTAKQINPNVYQEESLVKGGYQQPGGGHQKTQNWQGRPKEQTTPANLFHISGSNFEKRPIKQTLTDLERGESRQLVGSNKGSITTFAKKLKNNAIKVKRMKEAQSSRERNLGSIHDRSVSRNVQKTAVMSPLGSPQKRKNSRTKHNDSYPQMVNSEIWEQWNFGRKLDQAPLTHIFTSKEKKRRGLRGVQDGLSQVTRWTGETERWSEQKKIQAFHEILRNVKKMNLASNKWQGRTNRKKRHKGYNRTPETRKEARVSSRGYPSSSKSRGRSSPRYQRDRRNRSPWHHQKGSREDYRRHQNHQSPVGSLYNGEISQESSKFRQPESHQKIIHCSGGFESFDRHGHSKRKSHRKKRKREERVVYGAAPSTSSKKPGIYTAEDLTRFGLSRVNVEGLCGSEQRRVVQRVPHPHISVFNSNETLPKSFNNPVGNLINLSPKSPHQGLKSGIVNGSEQKRRIMKPKNIYKFKKASSRASFQVAAQGSVAGVQSPEGTPKKPYPRSPPPKISSKGQPGVEYSRIVSQTTKPATSPQIMGNQTKKLKVVKLGERRVIHNGGLGSMPPEFDMTDMRVYRERRTMTDSGMWVQQHSDSRSPCRLRERSTLGPEASQGLLSASREREGASPFKNRSRSIKHHQQYPGGPQDDPDTGKKRLYKKRHTSSVSALRPGDDVLSFPQRVVYHQNSSKKKLFEVSHGAVVQTDGNRIMGRAVRTKGSKVKWECQNQPLFNSQNLLINRGDLMSRQSTPLQSTLRSPNKQSSRRVVQTSQQAISSRRVLGTPRSGVGDLGSEVTPAGLAGYSDYSPGRRTSNITARSGDGFKNHQKLKRLNSRNHQKKRRKPKGTLYNSKHCQQHPPER